MIDGHGCITVLLSTSYCIMHDDEWYIGVCLNLRFEFEYLSLTRSGSLLCFVSEISKLPKLKRVGLAVT